MPATALLQRSQFLTLSFSGAGHLLTYHLGVATAIRTRGGDERPTGLALSKPIRAVAGSSSGAIAAAAFVYFPPRQLEEYADRFISDGGRAMHHFGRMLAESDGAWGEDGTGPNATTLHVATTRCSDGTFRSFDFPSNLPSSLAGREHLLKCLEASCKIPRQFHPSDVLPGRWPSTYPDEEGVLIDESYYVDGGISAPAPPTHLDTMEEACRIVISPISGGSNERNAIRISPEDGSLKFPIDLECRGGFTVHPSVQNIQAMQVSAGVAASPSILRRWFERGIEDGTRILHTS